MSILLRDGIIASSFQAIAADPDFETISYNGTGAAQNIVLSNNFQPDLALLLQTTGLAPAVTYWPVFDSTNGVGSYNALGGNSGTTTQTLDFQSLTSFNSNGFSLGTSADGGNRNLSIYQAFCWKKASGFLAIKQWTGNNTARTITHGLGVVPQLILITTASGTSNGIPMYNSGLGNTKVGYWQTGSGNLTRSGNGADWWNNTSPTTNVFSLGTDNIENFLNTTGSTYTGYIFAPSAGISAFGTYTGNGSISGPSVSGLGFTPSLVMIAGVTVGANLQWIYGNLLDAQLNHDKAFGSPPVSATNLINLVSGGFNVVSTSTDVNGNGDVYFYGAWE